MKRIICFLSLVAFFATGNAFSQESPNLETQLKVIFGDFLQGTKYKELRAIGRGLSLSGEMNFEMERIKAQNTYTINNPPPNTYVGPDNQLYPQQGYQWRNVSNPQDYSVIPIYTGNYATLPPYNMADITRNWYLVGFTTLKCLFVYNWYSDLNQNGAMDFSEFNGIKRTFQFGEKIELAFGFVSNTMKSGGIYFKVPYNTLTFMIQLFNAADGEIIISHQVQGYYKGDNLYLYKEVLGNYLPPGKYLVSVAITSSEKGLKYKSVTMLKDYFEVIE